MSSRGGRGEHTALHEGVTDGPLARRAGPRGLSECRYRPRPMRILIYSPYSLDNNSAPMMLDEAMAYLCDPLNEVVVAI